jgi:RNA polymerase sigma factor for flagellar operon FliA
MISAPAELTLVDVLDVVDQALASVARQLPAHVSRDDLASAGRLALVESFAKASGDVRAYCYVRVRGAILDELRRQDPVSRGARARARALAATRAALAAELGRDASTVEIAAKLGWSVSRVGQAETDAVGPVSLDFEGEDGRSVVETLVDEAAARPGDEAEARDVRSALVAALGRLTPGQATAVRIYFLDDGTLDDIAAKLGVSRERARQLRDAGVRRLREDFSVLAVWQGLIAA